MAAPELYEPVFEKICENIPGSEGPVFDRKGQFYMVAPWGTTKPPAGTLGEFSGDILKVNLADGSHSIVCKPIVDGHGGVPAGCQCDLDNNIWVADMRLGVLKMDEAGNFKQMFREDSEGRAVQGCNDCIFDYSGNLWITAPAGHIAPAPFITSNDEGFGSVYCLTTDDQTLVRVDTGLRFPNGLAVLHTADRKPSKLIVAETPTKILWQYDILGPGQVGPRSVWGKTPDDHTRGPDGLDFDDKDNLIVADQGGPHLEVYGPGGGDPNTRIKCPFNRPSNVHFQPGTNTVYVTEHQFNGLWRFTWKNPGKPQYCDLIQDN